MKTDKLCDGARARVIADYLNTDQKVSEIARAHKISVSVLSSWLRGAGVSRRSRGRRPLICPSTRSEKILAYAVAHGFSRAANHFNITRQHVSGIAKRWGVAPPKLTKAFRSSEKISPADKSVRKPRREIVICFRLHSDELSLLRASLPENITQATRSVHKLARAAILDRLAIVQTVRPVTAAVSAAKVR